MAMAADTVIAEPQETVQVGVIAPDDVMTRAVLVDRLIAREPLHDSMDDKMLIAKRLA